MNAQTSDLLIAFGFGLLALACLGLYAYCLIDLHRQPVKYQSKRTVWLNLIWAAPLVGCIIYLANRKRLWTEANS